MLLIILFILLVGAAVGLMLFMGENRQLLIPEMDAGGGNDFCNGGKPFVLFRETRAFQPAGTDTGPETKTFSLPLKTAEPGTGGSSKSPRPRALQNINISQVTRELIQAVMNMPDGEKLQLLQANSPHPDHPAGKNSGGVTKKLIDMIMKMSLAERCRLLGICKSSLGEFPKALCAHRLHDACPFFRKRISSVRVYPQHQRQRHLHPYGKGGNA